MGVEKLMDQGIPQLCANAINGGFRFDSVQASRWFFLFFSPIWFLLNLVPIKKTTRSFVTILGEFTLFVGETLRSFQLLWKRRGLFLKQCEFIGVQSLGIVTVAAVFLGAVLGYQLYMTLHRFGAEALLGGSVGVSLIREMGPVMCGIMVTGRAGAAMAAELASMRISEQIDALEVMAIDPFEYLVAPRVAAGVLVMPILAIFFSLIGTVAASGIACGVMGLQSTIFWHQFLKMVDPIDIVHCLVKSAEFGLAFSWIGCFFGFRAHGGALAVGQATRSTVVMSCLTILLSDYLITSLLPFGFKKLEVM
ncbi:MAG: MlaE family ABC transporter permease [Bdellovibrionia bacterium]